MPRAVAPRREEPAVEPLSPSFKRLLNQSSAGRYRPVTTPAQAPSVAPQVNSSATPSGGSKLREGMTIEHQRFGIGKVVKVEGTKKKKKATVSFQNVGTKQLLLKFAKYKVI